MGSHRVSCGECRVGLAADDSAGGEPSRLPLRLVLGQREAKLPPAWPAKRSPPWVPYRRRHACQRHHLRQLAPCRQAAFARLVVTRATLTQGRRNPNPSRRCCGSWVCTTRQLSKRQTPCGPGFVTTSPIGNFGSASAKTATGSSSTCDSDGHQGELTD